MSAPCSAFVSWPAAPLTDKLVKNTLSVLKLPVSFVDSPSLNGSQQLLQWSNYDEMDHELTLTHTSSVLSSSYTIRKALTRKHFLSRSILSYTTKTSESPLKTAAPPTYEIEISFADELEEILTDELWELGRNLDSENPGWWILKPGMADRGNGIRLFNSRDTLEKIFEEFEEDEDDDGEIQDTGTTVVTSQLRHFVVQEYLSLPVLIDPLEVSISGSRKPSELHGRKFHLRAYCVASGALQVFLYTRILSLFSSAPYSPPQVNEDGTPLDLLPHLTNTSLQTHQGEENVRLLDELVGSGLYNNNGEHIGQLSEEHVQSIIAQISTVLAEVFKAGLQNPVHFQVLPNAFELFGVDFLVTYPSPSSNLTVQVHLLEFNSEPAIELTGLRLNWILEDLFMAIGKVCIEPFFSDVREDSWNVGETRHNLTKCLEQKLHFG